MFFQAALETARKELTNDMSQNFARGKVCQCYRKNYKNWRILGENQGFMIITIDYSNQNNTVTVELTLFSSYRLYIRMVMLSFIFF